MQGEGPPGDEQCSHSTGAVTPSDDVDIAQPVVCRVGALGQHYWTWVNRPHTGHPRFFGSPLLEACSKTPWWLVPLLWLPYFTYCFWRTHMQWGTGLPVLFIWLLIGVVAWQLLEYIIHRFVFHARPSSYWGITLHFLFHGCHHKYPFDSLRLVFPPVPASALVWLVYVTLHALLPPSMALPMFAGMGYGYVAYDCLHYAIHFHGSSLRGMLLRDLKQRHMHHHYKDQGQGFGISSSLFDVVFQTCAAPSTL